MSRWWRESGPGTALAFAELGAVGLFAAGVVTRVAGTLAPAYLLVAVVVGFAVRAVDLEGCALFLSGGSYGAARQAFGTRASVLAAAMLLAGYTIFGALAASAAGRALLAGLREAGLRSSRSDLALGRRQTRPSEAAQG